MTTETDTANKFVTAVNKGDVNGLKNVLADNFTFQMAGVPGTMNRNEFVGMIEGLRTAFPDWNFGNVKFQSQTNPVKATIDTTGTHKGPLDLTPVGGKTVPPTGKSFKNAQEPCTFVVENGKITKHTVDSTEGGINGMLDQLGIQAPAPSR